MSPLARPSQDSGLTHFLTHKTEKVRLYVPGGELVNPLELTPVEHSDLTSLTKDCVCVFVCVHWFRSRLEMLTFEMGPEFRIHGSHD